MARSARARATLPGAPPPWMPAFPPLPGRPRCSDRSALAPAPGRGSGAATTPTGTKFQSNEREGRNRLTTDSPKAGQKNPLFAPDWNSVPVGGLLRHVTAPQGWSLPLSLVVPRGCPRHPRVCGPQRPPSFSPPRDRLGAASGASVLGHAAHGARAGGSAPWSEVWTGCVQGITTGGVVWSPSPGAPLTPTPTPLSQGLLFSTL